MAGPLTIQRFPKGLLGLLGSQVGGDTPAELAPAAVAVLDILQFYGSDLRQNAQVNVGNLAVGGFTLISTNATSCASGEIRLLHEFSVQCSTAAPAATDITVAVAIQRAQGAPVMFTFEPRQNVQAGDFLALGVHFETPLLMLPGDALGIVTPRSAAGGPIGPCFIQSCYTRIPI